MLVRRECLNTVQEVVAHERQIPLKILRHDVADRCDTLDQQCLCVDFDLDIGGPSGLSSRVQVCARSERGNRVRIGIVRKFRSGLRALLRGGGFPRGDDFRFRSQPIPLIAQRVIEPECVLG